MKLLELEIHDIRGIRDLSLNPQSSNIVLWGPNGSGKSAVVDALDFLLTGNITRLTGKGTFGLKLDKHGPHIDATPKTAFVRAKVQLPGITKPVEIERSMARPKVLQCDAALKTYLEPALNLAQRGQHVLTRREILRYITADANTRAQGIQELLNLAEVEDVRKAFVKVKNDSDDEARNAEHNLSQANAIVASTIQQPTYNPDGALVVINQNRVLLGGREITSLHSTQLKIDLTPPTVVSPGPASNITLLERDIDNLRNVISEGRIQATADTDNKLRDLIATIRSDPHLLRAFTQQRLIQLGLSMIDNTGSCPLCETSWPAGQLKEHLQHRLAAAEEVAKHHQEISQCSFALTSLIETTLATIRKVLVAAQHLDLPDEILLLRSWLTSLEGLRALLDDPIENYPDTRFPPDRAARMLAPDSLPLTFDRVLAIARIKFPLASLEQTAWDTLTSLIANFTALERSDGILQGAKLSQRRAHLLLATFETVRDDVLAQLYNNIRDRFVEFYAELHAHDENDFSATLKSEGAGLHLEVGFFGRGIHPPHALHSEGHQDSMGLCLYLALAEHLTGNFLDLFILDDVVMSIDADHRRQICHILKNFFPSRQFLITTHDRTWAYQLKSEGVVSSRNMIEFYNWHVGSGPQVNHETDIWNRIETDLQKNDVPAAAHRLRRGAEDFFASTSDSLKAPVAYKINSRWELGDFLPATIGQYSRLLKSAKSAASSWSDTATVQKLVELDSVAGQIFKRSSVEQWAINANVHYNNWANFSEKDFRPVVQAFVDLWNLFMCNACHGILRLTITGVTPMNVRCSCGKVNWNLTEKSTKT